MRTFDPTKARERVIRNDRSKADLAERVRGAAAAPGLADVAALALIAMSEAMWGCRSVMVAQDHCGAYLAHPISCRSRLCPDCERSRSGRLAARLAELAMPMAQPRFGTLTIANAPEGQLGATVDVLLGAFALLRHRALFTGAPCRLPHYEDPPGEPRSSIRPGVACVHPPHRDRAACACARCTGCRRCVHDPVRGGIYALEITWNRVTRTWHAHIHFLLDGPWIDQRELRDAWTATTCDAQRRFDARGGTTSRGTGLPKQARALGRVVIPRCHHVDWALCATSRVGPDGRPHRDEQCACGMTERAAGCRCLRCARAAGCRGSWMVWIEAPRDRSPEGIATAVREVVKYVTKGLVGHDGRVLPGVGGSELAELLLTIKGRRLIAGWGRLAATGDRVGVDVERADADDVSVWPDPRAGFPKICPRCLMPAAWTDPVCRSRRECVPDAQGRLWWRPPPVDEQVAA